MPALAALSVPVDVTHIYIQSFDFKLAHALNNPDYTGDSDSNVLAGIWSCLIGNDIGNACGSHQPSAACISPRTHHALSRRPPQNRGFYPL